jgi:copper chaperone CopZ
MKTIKVPTMMCENCVKRILEEFKVEGIPVTVDLKTKTVTVEDEDADFSMDLLEDIGFEIEE